MVQDPKNRKYSTLCFSSPSHFAQDPIALSGKAMAPHSSTLAWKIQCMEEPGGLQSWGR